VSLDLSYTRVKDEGGLALARSPYLVNLAKLDLEACSLTRKVVTALKERFGARVKVDE
jgi:hypothetical protein